MISNFHSLTKISLETGGSSSFEWPRWCTGWAEVEELQDMISHYNMFSTYPCGCAFDLTVQGLKPLKPWRIITTSDRLAVEMSSKVCRHPKGFKHDRLEGGRLAYLSGFYNRNMAFSILCSLFPQKFLEGIPHMMTAVDDSFGHDIGKLDRIADQLSSGVCLQHALGLVHRVLTKKEIQKDPKAVEAIKKEIDDVRSMKVWDDDSVLEHDDLRAWAKRNNQEVHIAEVKEIGSIKHDELGPSLSQHKGRLVFRGDLTRNQDGLPAKFRELHSQPASIMTVAIVLFYGMIGSNCTFIADAKRHIFRRNYVA